MGFTPMRTLYPGGISKRWNPHDKGEGAPNPVVCDSVLDFREVDKFTNAVLTIYLSVWFEPVSSSVGKVKDSDGVVFEVLDWTPADDFPGWCRRVADKVTRFWDDKLLLILPERYDGLDWKGRTGGVWQPLVRCRFVFLVGDATYFHARVKVLQFKSRPDDAQFRSHSRLWSIDMSAELTKVHKTLGDITQVGACHETGHLLGLKHVGKLTTVKGCTMLTDHWEAACYGKEDPNPSVANNIMGMGMQLSGYNALPWKQEFCKHANQDETWGKLDPDEVMGTTWPLNPRMRP
jgi:hypothetical protein